MRFFAETRVRIALQKSKPLVGAWMRRELASLGPAYIKFGQFLSTRPDIVGKEIVQELELLQDDILPVPFADIVEVFEGSLNTSIAEAFEYIDPVPIASASIGQVHRGRLRKKTGNPTDTGRGLEVAIKVQRPSVARLIRQDMNTLKGLNAWLAKIGSPRAQEFAGIVEQYDVFLSSELDFNKERAHMRRFIKIMDDGGLNVKIPRPIERLSSDQVLVMEYVPSTKITDVVTLRKRGVDTAQLADTLINAFMYQIITAAYIHCDPHPGNIGVMDDGETLVLYDFGNVVELSKDFKKELNQIVLATFQKDVDEFVNILVKLKILILTSEEDFVEARTFFSYLFDYLSTLDFTSLRDSLSNGDLAGTLQSNLKLDSDFFSLFRVFSLLDGTCLKLDGTFNYIDALSPFTDDLMFDMKFIDIRARKDFDKMRAYPSMMKATDVNVARMTGKLKKMETSQTQVTNLLVSGVVFSNIEHPVTIAIFLGSFAIYWVYINKIQK